MKKMKPNLKKMFSFHTIVLAVLVVLQSQRIEGRHQIKHNHFSHNKNQHYNYHNDDVKQNYRKHHHLHHHHHHHQHQQQQQPTTPSVELTYSSTAVNTDNTFLFKQDILKDILSKTENNKSISSTSSSSSSSTALISSHLTKQNDFNTQQLSSNSTMITSPTLSNNVLEHIYHNQDNEMYPTPMPSQQSTYLMTPRYIDNHILNNTTSRYSNPSKSSKLNLTTVDLVSNEQQHQQHNFSTKQEYDTEQEQQQNDDDYYEEYGEDYSDAADDADAISDEDDNSLSDRSYARITRSKLDDEYVDDEPYHSEINDYQMQSDAEPGSITEQKYSELGSEKAVIQARERYIQDQKRPRTPHELATAHWHRMIQATKCRKPFPRVIPVSNNTSKHYEPYATILHRCGEDTGCCGSTASVCTVKRYEIVMVYVFSYDFNYRKEIEAMPMQNHTECHCVNRGSLLHDSMPRDKRSGVTGGGGGYMHQFQRLQKQQQKQNVVPNNEFHHHQDYLQNVLGCHCPRHFNVFEADVERLAHLPRPHSVFTRKCRCDCLINNQTCLRFKHGDEGFSLEDRKCILEHNCKPPVCSYGDYNLRIGRCPGYTSHLSQMI